MPSIKVNMSGSWANITSGRLTFTPKESFKNADNRIVQGGIAFPSVTIASGNASFVIDSTQDTGIAYTFVLESGTAPNFTFVDRFDAVIPNVTPQTLDSLLQSFQTNDLLDTSIQSITDLLTRSPYIDKLSVRIPGFTQKPWNATTAFSKNELTFRGERFYKWIKDTQGTNIDPLVAANRTDPGNYQDGVINAAASWQVVSSSLVGAGTTTTAVTYDQASFEALATTPASRKNLNELRANILANVSTPNLTPYARKDTQNTFDFLQVFAGGLSTADLSANDNSSSIPNTRTVRSIIAASPGNGLSLLNRASILEERYNPGVARALNAGSNLRGLNATLVNSGDIVSLSGGVARVKAGTYLVIVNATHVYTSGYKLILQNESNGDLISSRSMSGYAGRNLTTDAITNAESTLMDLVTFGSDISIGVRSIVETGDAFGSGRPANRSGYGELYTRFMLFRLN
ncbi:hypothetical protein [Chroococcidiopsis sp.]|uniref:hypothetical protein n=1 Tax=Chroococcidiopsis sp. TaxID=3088168 RepID=UPI003F39BEFC